MDAHALDDQISHSARKLVALAKAKGISIATAESCTAGMVAARIADIPGASEVLYGGAVTYRDRAKHEVLGIPEEVLDTSGAVSDPCARAMAVCARTLFHSCIAVSITGYAGPGGDSAHDPVGTVYIGLADRHGSICRRCAFEGERAQIRRLAVLAALNIMVDSCSNL